MARWRTRIGAIFLASALAALAGVRPAAANFSSLVIDAKTGVVLEQYNADVRNYPASLTKMMTLYLTFEAVQSGRLRLNQVLHASAHAAVQAPSRIDLTYGEPITVEQAILALTVKSANDAAVVLGEALGGTESHFAQLMNRKAHQLGMTSTNFRNASGLPNLGQVTTARDMATLARALLRDYPQDYHYFDAREFTFRSTTILTHNHVLTEYQGADGFKTGYIHASGFNIVSSAVRDGHRLIGVVLGGQTIAERDRAVMSLLDTGFAYEGVVSVASAATPSALPASEPDETDALVPQPAAPVASLPAAVPAPTPGTPPVLMVADPGADSASDPAANPGSDKIAAATLVPNPAPAPNKPTLAASAPVADKMADDATSTVGIRAADWAIQVGAFGRIALAQWAARKAVQLAPLLHKATISIGRVRVADGTVYRARLIGLSEEEARTACVSLHKRRGECLLVPPGSDRAIAQVQ